MDYFAKRIIPCLDVKDGRVVKGVNFVGLKDAGDPVEVAKRYNEEGADEITFLDIGASHEGRDTIVDIVEKVAKEVFIPLTVGGGIRKLEDIYALLNVGCDKVSINSAAIKRPELINEAAQRFGAQCIVVAIDVKREATTTMFISTADVSTPVSMPLTGPKRPLTAEQGRSCSPRWTLTAPKPALTSRSHNRSANWSMYRSLPVAEQGRWNTSKRPSTTVPTRRLLPVSFTTKRSISWT